MALKDGQLRAQNYWLDDNGRIDELRDGWLLAKGAWLQNCDIWANVLLTLTSSGTIIFLMTLFVCASDQSGAKTPLYMASWLGAKKVKGPAPLSVCISPCWSTNCNQRVFNNKRWKQLKKVMDPSASLAPCHKHHLQPKSVKNKDGEKSSASQCLHQLLL